MHGLSAEEQLHIWEQGQKQTSGQRALLLLAAGCPEIPMDQRSQISIGQRDQFLLALQDLTFGPQMDCLVKCPECSDPSEFHLMTTEIRMNANNPSEDGYGTRTMEVFAVDKYEVTFRLPNSQDFLELALIKDGILPHRYLLERCLSKVLYAQEQVPVDRLPQKAIEAVIERMAQLDPFADIWLNLTCPTCGHPWQAPFDIVSFLWNEICMMAQRILYDIHVLAKAYGWSEMEILTMSPFRRQCYIFMAAK